MPTGVAFMMRGNSSKQDLIASYVQVGKEVFEEEIQFELSKFEDENGFSGPCELVVGVGQKPLG